MRFALPAVAATSGLGLLILAFYGQPAVFLQQAREQWHAVFVSLADDPQVERDNVVVGERMARLQQQVARLEDELTARQTPAPQASPPSPAASAPRVPDFDVSRVAPPIVPAKAPPIKAMPPPITVPERNEAEGSPMPLQAVPLQAVPLQAVPLQAVPLQAVPLQAVPVQAVPLQAGPVQAGPVQATHPQAEPAKPEPSQAEPTTPEAPKPAVLKLASVKPAPAPPLLPQNSTPRPDIDDTKSVLARLRQQPAAPTTAQQAEMPQAAEPRPPRSTASPFVPRLTAARAALGLGRIEAARGLLQEAQLQLVFRPVDAPGDETSSASPSSGAAPLQAPSLSGRAAANVARALEALSVNDVPLSRRYIDAAVNDLSGAATDTPVQQSDRRTPGYAPAYPPR